MSFCYLSAVVVIWNHLCVINWKMLSSFWSLFNIWNVKTFSSHRFKLCFGSVIERSWRWSEFSQMISTFFDQVKISLFLLVKGNRIFDSLHIWKIGRLVKFVMIFETLIMTVQLEWIVKEWSSLWSLLHINTRVVIETTMQSERNVIFD